MSEQLPSDPSAIVHQVQSLDDIEQNLADTAAAVIQSDPKTLDPQAADTEDATTLLGHAEAMESVLENAIPHAPVPASESAASDAVDEVGNSLVGGLPVATLDPPQEAATQATEATTIPVLAGEEVVEPPVVSETEDVTVDVEIPTTSNVVEAALNPENGSVPAEISATLVQEAPIAPQSTPAVPPPVVDTTAQTPMTHVLQPEPQVLSTTVKPEELPATWTPIATRSSDAPLPGGLTEYSPSVRNNGDLIRSWRTDPKNSMIILALFNWSVQKTEVEDARVWHELLAIDNPTASQPLLALINLELSLSNFTEVETIFAKTLKGNGEVAAATDVGIWMAYLHYIRRQNSLSDGASNEVVRTTITQAYEFALQECGFDRESGAIWDEYLKFIASSPSSNQWELQAKNDNLRKAYRRAVVIPLNNIEALWKSYDAFETSLNKSTSKKFLAEKSPAYMTARTALRELRTLTGRIPKDILPPKPTFKEQDRQMINAWKAYLKWEEGNPLMIEDTDVLGSRIGYALRKCLGEMRHFPELWYHVAVFYSGQDKQDKAAEVLKAGVEACPKSFLITFALAEVEEERKNYALCHTLYADLVSRLNPDVDDLRRKVEYEVEVARGPPIPGSDRAAAIEEAGDVDMDGNDLNEIQRLVEEREKRGQLVAERRGQDVEELRVGISVVWTMYMRFARRAEGIKAARGVFGKARKSPHLTWHVFEASAMMEYHSNKDSAVAIRIFELGFKQFSEDVDYVVKYLQFLLSINDDNNARALFERSAAKVPVDKARPLWDTWARYEYTYGDLTAVLKLEARFTEVFPADAPLRRFAQRWAYNGIDQIAIQDLGFNRARVSQPAPTPAPAPELVPAIPQAAAAPVPTAAPSLAPTDHQDTYKRPAPEIDNHHLNDYAPPRSPKRHRGPSPRRFPEREWEDPSSGIGRHARDPPNKRDLTPNSMPSMGHPGGGPVYPPSVAAPEKDRSGLPKPLAWFMSQLPNARTFDGPVFRPDDIMNIFNNISLPSGGMPLPVRAPAPAPPVYASRSYQDSDRRYGPPSRGRY